MKPSACLAILAAFALAFPARADEGDAPAGGPTFYRDIVPILQAQCQVCHRPAGNTNSGMVAPMSLMTYDDVRPWAKSVAKEAQARTMPPWFASAEFDGVFELERKLTDAQIAMISKWVSAGAPRGDEKDAPPPVEFASPDGWTFGQPDVVIQLPEPYWVADEVEDIQPSFPLVLTEQMLPEDRWIKWIEFRPGSNVVHHGGASVQTLGPDGKPVKDPVAGGKIIGTAPGDTPDLWPEGYGKLVRKGSRLTFNIHYHKEKGPGTGVWDKSSLAIKWQEKPVQYVVRSAGVSSLGWEIPPGHANWEVGAAHTFNEDSYIINMMPHMHMRGRESKYVAVYPDGKRELLLHVPNYDYNWQMTYTYKKPKFVPAGTRLEVTMWYDNSTANSRVPDPQRAVGFGGMTTDEMNIGWTEYANAKPIENWQSHDFGPLDPAEAAHALSGE